MFEKELTISKKAAKEAGRQLKKEFLKNKRKDAKFKTAKELVTTSDKHAEKIILGHLKKNFSSYAILSEESGLLDKPSDYFWVVDPLDGTTNFTIHHPMFAVSIALFYKNEIVLGVTYNPILDEMYWASKNQGAYKDGKKIKVSTNKEFKKSIITYCHGSGPLNTKKAYRLYQHFHDLSHHCRHFGCTSLELAMLANGKTEAHMITGAKLWDVAAGVIIVREAGGLVTDWKNKAWNKKSSTILAGNKPMHPSCLKELKKLKLA